MRRPKSALVLVSLYKAEQDHLLIPDRVMSERHPMTSVTRSMSTTAQVPGTYLSSPLMLSMSPAGILSFAQPS